MEHITFENGKALGYVIPGEITDSDLNVMNKDIEEKLKAYEKVRLYLELTDFEGYESLKTFWHDLKKTLGHFNDFERIAIVTDKDWLEWAVKLTDMVNKADIRAFEFEDRAYAQQWID